MLDNYAFLYSAVTINLRTWEEELIAGTAKAADLPSWLDWLEHLCADLEMDVALEQTEWLRAFAAQKVPVKQMAEGVAQLRERILAHLRSRKFLYVRPALLRYYDAGDFGSETRDAFPSTIYDVEEAGKCLALGRGTACVFHLMRVMEVGLKAIAKPLGISYAPSWEGYLRQITARIANKPRRKSIKWKRDKHLFEELAGDLTSVKIAWRNPTMHIRRRYDVEEAEQVFEPCRFS